MKIERTRIQFLSDVFPAVDVLGSKGRFRDLRSGDECRGENVASEKLHSHSFNLHLYYSNSLTLKCRRIRLELTEFLRTTFKFRKRKKISS